MKKYFELEDLMDVILDNPECEGCTDVDCFTCIREWLLGGDVPEADVVPGTRGKWVLDEVTYQCPVCGRVTYRPGKQCPECGTFMGDDV